MREPDLTGQRVFVAGGAGNVGRELVAALLGAGATVAVSSRSPTRLERLRESIADDAKLVTIAGNIADEGVGAEVRAAAIERMGGIDAAVASLGAFVPARSILEAGTADLLRALHGYVIAHHAAARVLIPALRGSGGSYTMINGLLAFEPRFAGASLIATASAAQAMLARLLMRELNDTEVRVNEVVLYTSFGRPDDDERNREGVSRAGACGFIARLISHEGRAVRGRTIHLESAASLDT